MKIQLVDRNDEMVNAWMEAFHPDGIHGSPDIVIYQGDFFSLKTDCVVSPANSFGYMDGGLDLAISDKLGWDVQKNLQEYIKQTPLGELLVGQVHLVKTTNIDIPWCLSAPTMRVPLRLDGTYTPNPYLASKAIFNFLKTIDETVIGTITIPGMGTGVGKLPYDICAHQMKKAYDEVWLGKKDFPNNIWDAQRQHYLLNKYDILEEQKRWDKTR